MKTEWMLSFKRWLSRPVAADMRKIKLWRQFFSVKFIAELEPDILIANWDEFSINRNTKINYSWSIKGMNKEVKNSSLVELISIIMIIFSNGCWFLMLSNSNTNSNMLLNYMKSLIIC